MSATGVLCQVVSNDFPNEIFPKSVWNRTLWSTDTTLGMLTYSGHSAMEVKIPYNTEWQVLFWSTNLCSYSSMLLENKRSWVWVNKSGNLYNTSRVHVMYLTLLTCRFISKSPSLSCKERSNTGNSSINNEQLNLTHTYKALVPATCCPAASASGNIWTRR